MGITTTRFGTVIDNLVTTFRAATAQPVEIWDGPQTTTQPDGTPSTTASQGIYVGFDGDYGRVWTGPDGTGGGTEAGEDDFVVGKKYGLEVLCPVDDKGVLTNEAPGFEGLFYDKANKPITEKLEEDQMTLSSINAQRHVAPFKR